MTVSPTIAEQMAAFSTELNWRQIPDSVRHAAVRHLADTLACAIAAAAEPDAEAIEISRKYALRGIARPEATIIGSLIQTEVRSASFVNCTMARYIDANDIYLSKRDGGHFSDAIPAVLAMAEMTVATGQALLEAIVVAYEIQAVLAESYRWMTRGFHSVSQVTVGVAAAVARLLGLDSDRTTHAINLAMTSGLILQSWLKPSESVPAIKSGSAGLTAERGILCAELAADGITGPPDAIETLFDLLPSDSDPEPVRWLGKRWTTNRNAIKPVPAQIYTQAVIQCAEHLYQDGLRLDQVASITVRSNDGACGRVQGAPEAFTPQTRESADHSTPFVVAMTLRDGPMSPATYDGRPWLIPELREAMARMELIIDDAWQRNMVEDGVLGAEMIAIDMAGKRYEAVVDQFTGHPDRPLSDLQLVDKLEKFLARPHIQSQGAGSRLFDACLAVEHASSIADLVMACQITPPGDTG